MSVEPAIKSAVDEWLGEIENFSLRAERLPEGKVAEWMPWLYAAAEIGAATKGLTTHKYNLGQLRHLYTHLIRLNLYGYADGIVSPIIKDLEKQTDGR